MTALCPGGGTSSPNFGAAAVLDYSAGLIALRLTATATGWLIPIIALLGLEPLVLATFCASDPPAIPTFTSAEADALLQLNFGSADFTSGLGKARDWVIHAIWYDVCHCDSGSPTVLAPPSAPSGTPIFQPPSIGSNAPCDSVPMRTVTSFVGPSPGLLTTQPITYVVFNWSNTVLTGAGGTYSVNLTNFFDQSTPTSSLVNLGFNTFSIVPGETQTKVFQCPVGTNFVRPDVTFLSGSGTSTIRYQIDGYCGIAPPGAAASPCCPPDPATQASLDLILGMVTLIQRQAVPFAYVSGPAHAGLSGAGVLDIAGLLGVRVDVTTLPGHFGVEGTTPPLHFDLGFITFGTADGYPQSYRVNREHQLALPARCGLFTDLAYDLSPGVVITITEIVREP